MKATEGEIRAFINDRPEWFDLYAMGELELIESSMAFAWWRVDRAFRDLGQEILKAMPAWLRRWIGVE